MPEHQKVHVNAVHQHDEHCACGHDHHNHAHDENGRCILPEQSDVDGIHVESRLHDEAHVISGRLTIAGDYETVRQVLQKQLERVAEAVRERGGIVGHIKASCEVKFVEMFSVTDKEVAVKKAPEQEIKINLAAIVFLIEQNDAEEFVSQALKAVRNGVNR